jgi:diguanylate cyclase (GGDEF)-like protein
LPYVLRQLAAVVSGAICAAEARATSERIGVLDAATGLHDRKSAETYLRRELARARRYREPLSLVSIDLDRFSELNEQWGYQNGDRVLKEVARLLIGFPSTDREMTGIALCLRESDLAARVGPDAFLVLLPATSHEGARLAAERFLGGLRQHRVQLDEQSVGVTATGAVVTFPDDGDTAEELTVLANRLVAEAAREGGDRLVVAAPRLVADLERERGAHASPG